jgi:hypothetical protein
LGVIEKSVTWTKRGLKDLHKISIFNSKAIGKKKALEIAHKVIDAPKILENPEYDFKNIGSIDDSFNHLKQVHLTPFVCL